MKLYEFFGNNEHDVNKDQDSMDQGFKEEEKQLADQIFWFILDNDDMHKKYFLPIAKDIKNKHLKNSKELMHHWKVWLPMVNNACVKFFEKNDLHGDPKESFSKKLRIDLCKRLVEHYHQDILKDEYQLGH